MQCNDRVREGGTELAIHLQGHRHERTLHSEKRGKNPDSTPRSHDGTPPQPTTTADLSQAVRHSPSSMPPRVLAPMAMSGVTRVLLLAKWEVDILTCF